ncbi:FAD-dependent monooxygenase (plasmid) [Streptomyces sp. BH-SS-21]|uniref:FAD-dependent monooxygenase n=1 Tax=Streptomyces liliiviolaceus TaxID=2823109 RepID=A0A941BEV4_9ACTN|nr:FAD-dependent monooxygenase [Streptomyces liliiviolaceus]MBQ0855643.1 FAD-dependent monooxygenase [Streptomyces liliiviolaceus]
MRERDVVVSGASIAGLSTAFWLRRLGWQVTVIERAPAFRDGGQNVDVRGVAREVLDRMGLFDEVKRQNTTETGTVVVDASGKVTAELPFDGPGGPDGATAELEVLRGDFARTIHDHLPPGVAFVYGDTIETATDGPESLHIVTSQGRELRCDLLVIAEGVRSATRDRVFTADEVTQDDLDVTMVFGTIPRTAGDDDRWRWHNTTRGRQIHLRPDNHGTTRAILAYSPGDDLARLGRGEALARVRDRYADAGWEAPRVLDAFDASDDVYIDQLTQIRMTTWHRGRTVLAGDAGWCVTPMGGGGASLALTSGYVLAAQLAAHPDDTEAALTAYEAWMRPLVDDVQGLPRGLKHFAYPQTRTGLALRHLAGKVLTSPPLKPLAAKLTQVAETKQALPEIPQGAA